MEPGKGVCEEREQGMVDWCLQLCEWLETEYTDNGQTTYKNRILIHNLQQPAQKFNLLFTVTSPGSQAITLTAIGLG